MNSEILVQKTELETLVGELEKARKHHGELVAMVNEAYDHILRLEGIVIFLNGKLQASGEQGLKPAEKQ